MNPDSKRSKVLWSHHAASIPPISWLKLVLNYNQYSERLFNSDCMSSLVGITTEDYADRVTTRLRRGGPKLPSGHSPNYQVVAATTAR